MTHAPHVPSGSAAPSPRPDAPLGEAVQHAFGPEARVVAITPMAGDMSTRAYERVTLAGAPVATAVAMRLPADALAPCTEPAKLARGGSLPFADVQRAAHRRGLPVPAIYAELTAQGNFTVLLEDLGDETFLARLERIPREQWLVWYARAVELLCAWQRAFRDEDPGCIAYARRFDRAFLRWELDHFREWGIEARRGPLPPALRAALDAEFDRLADDVAALPTVLMHRDFQSKNLMVQPDERLALIDFQDAAIGPRPYDLVALLCDSYTALTRAEQAALRAQYCQGVGLATVAGRASFEREFHTQAVQRKLKDAGRFVFIDRVRGNPGYLPFIPQSVRYVQRSLAELPERARLGELLRQAAPDWFDNAE